ncbi:hypothetical protein [Leptospira paudalimensis]|uniref:Uncharacterized protein n=1 Tax=Leptospira paudalimensis TaxID=2950024 RepID=A0ABT3M585_9LEPT|nr:hypothetical protein [Leptospira paudalimensis]MCW7503545.1 hypothetical protein [Leptospira paudalimensis]
MENVWKDINKTGKIKNPIEIVDEIFLPLPKETNDIVIYEIQKVNFFPEEVRFTDSFNSQLGMATAAFLPKKEPHPEFGYDPTDVSSSGNIRFRLLLRTSKAENISVELFKVRFPILFYPLRIFCDRHTFPMMEKYFDKDVLLARSESEYIERIKEIVTSETTKNIVQALLSF